MGRADASKNCLWDATYPSLQPSPQIYLLVPGVETLATTYVQTPCSPLSQASPHPGSATSGSSGASDTPTCSIQWIWTRSWDK